MPYVSSKNMLADACAGNYAVCAFNAENLEMLQAIIWGASELNAPVIIQTTPSTIKYTGCEYFRAVVETAGESSRFPVSLHLDHGESLELVALAIDAGYSSVMLDGSRLSFEENIKLTRQAVKYACALGVPVEAELGKVGGKEDGVGDALEVPQENYADPQQAREFVARTLCDSLAVGIGTAHGVYKDTPKLDLGRLAEIKKLVDVPLVLHGATGLSDNIIKECVSLGINKINYATELRQAYTLAVREKLSDASIIDPKIYSGHARDRVREVVKSKIRLSGSVGKIK